MHQPEDEWSDRFEYLLYRDWYSWRRIFNKYWWKGQKRAFYQRLKRLRPKPHRG